ncbi:MAG: glycosyltransferase family 4 protein [Chitinophagaceae bacterium]
MKKLLIFVDWFLPGYKAGGQIRSCANLAFALKDVMDVHVVTTDRDLGDEQAYDTVIKDEWITLDDNLRVLYLSPKKRGFKSIQSIIRLVNPHCVYLNSMFSFNFTLLPIEICRYDDLNTKIILAPRGMLHKGALQFKNFKKKIFFHAFKVRGFQKRIVFHATDITEETDIKNIFGQKSKIEFVLDYPSSKQDALEIIEKKPGSLKCVFVSRISPKKNLLFLIALLKKVKSNVSLSIVGPVEEEEYWNRCLELVNTLPSNIKVDYLGAIPNHDLAPVYRQNHLFILPTHGENFGHVIFESLLNGRPVLISDHTPWKDLESQNLGWDLPLSDKQDFLNRLEEAANWNQDQFNSYCASGWQFAHAYNKESSLKKEYLELFN